MHGERKLNPALVALAAAGFAFAVVAPLWAFYNVTVQPQPKVEASQTVSTH